MNWIDTCVWYLNNIWIYVQQMIPCMLLAVVLFFLVFPVRRKILEHHALSSSIQREAVLLLFIMFMAGLSALTLFPADIWMHFINAIRTGSIWIYGFQWSDYFPPFEESVLRLQNLGQLLHPFDEIRRAFRAGPWFMFMLLGNIGIFMPIGFFSSLLWRKPSWWRAVLLGFICSTGIEFVQLFVGRRTDIDDVLLNTLGSLLGFILFWGLRLLFPAFLAGFQCQPVRRNMNG